MAETSPPSAGSGDNAEIVISFSSSKALLDLAAGLLLAILGGLFTYGFAELSSSSTKWIGSLMFAGMFLLALLCCVLGVAMVRSGYKQLFDRSPQLIFREREIEVAGGRVVHYCEIGSAEIYSVETRDRAGNLLRTDPGLVSLCLGTGERVEIPVGTLERSPAWVLAEIERRAGLSAARACFGCHGSGQQFIELANHAGRFATSCRFCGGTGRVAEKVK